jgi:hypothetical protein
MNNTTRLTLGTMCGCLLTIGVSMSAHAGFVITGGSAQGLPIVDNKFNTELTGLGFSQMSSGAQLRVDQDGFVDFYYIGAESGFNNSFTGQGAGLSGNNKGFLSEHNEAFDFSGYAGFTIAVSANDILDFSFTSDDATALTPVDNLHGTNLQGLGIYFDSSNADPLQQIVLGYDDQTIDDDNDFEDMLVRADFRPGLPGPGADVSTVPLPAAVWLFGTGLAALGGLARQSARRRH